MGWKRFGWFSWLLVVSACNGSVSGDVLGDGPGTPGAPGSSVPGAPGRVLQPGEMVGRVCETDDLPPPLPFPRISKSTYEQLVQDAFGVGVVSSSSVPSDSGRYLTEPGPLTNEHIRGYHNAAMSLATAFTADPAQFGARLNCNPGAIDEACGLSFVTNVAQALQRRQLPAEDQASIEETIRSTGEVTSGVSRALAQVLESPHFLYEVQLGQSGTDRLTSAELAARLAMVLWGTAPDDELLDAAGRGDLDTIGGLRAQAERMLTLPAARRRIREFTGQWLKFERIAPPAFSPGFVGGRRTDDIDTQIKNEIGAFAEHLVLDEEAPLSELFLSRTARVDHPVLSEIYGVPQSDSWVELPPERAGLLTRAALLYSGIDSANPILRGATVRQEILCGNLPPPPPDALSMAMEEERGSVSSREFYDALTSGGTCQGCHTLMNPIGHALGRFDSMGHHVSLDRVFVDGVEVASFPIDDSVDSVAVDGLEDLAVTGAVELSEAVATSDVAATCFAQHLFHFTRGREASTEEQCVLEEMAAAAQISMKEAWLTMVLHASFQRLDGGVR